MIFKVCIDCNILDAAYCDMVKENHHNLHDITCIFHNFHIHTVHLYITKVFIYSPTDEQVNCLKNNFKIYIKIHTKTAPTYFDVTATPSSGSELLVLAKVTVVKLAN